MRNGYHNRLKELPWITEILEADVRGLQAAFESLARKADELEKTVGKKRFQTKYRSQIQVLMNQFNDACTAFNGLVAVEKSKLSLRTLVNVPLTQDAVISAFDLIRLESTEALGALTALHKPLTQQELDRVTALRREVGDATKSLSDDSYSRNIAKAIDEYESGHFLASALIASRVVMYVLQGIKGDNINDKILALIETGALKSGRDDIKQSIIKANNKARNFLSHDIKVTAEASDALALLGDAVRLLSLAVSSGQ